MQTIIKIDWDSKIPPDCGIMASVISRLGLTPFSMELTHSRSHWHVIIKTPKPLGEEQIIAVQLLLGSDPHRELYNLFRVLRTDAPLWWRKRWNVLFKGGKHVTVKKTR